MLERFCAGVSKRQHAHNRKFIREFVWGFLGGDRALVSKIYEGINDRRTLNATSTYASRHLEYESFQDDLCELDYLDTCEPYLRQHRGTLGIVLDLTHIHKPWPPFVPMGARKAEDFVPEHQRPRRRGGYPMPYTAWIQDVGARNPPDRRRRRRDRRARQRGEKAKQPKSDGGPGYKILSIQAVAGEGRQMVLCNRLYSHAAPDWRGLRPLVFGSISLVAPYLSRHNAVWLVDAEFCGSPYRGLFNRLGFQFVAGLGLGTNTLIYESSGERSWYLRDLAQSLLPTHGLRLPRRTVRKYEGTARDIQVSVSRIRFAAHNEKLHKLNHADETVYNMLLIDGIASTRMGLLTTLPAETDENILRIIDLYGDRWLIETKNRFLKNDEGLGLKKIRVRTYSRLQRFVRLATLVEGFVGQMSFLPSLERDCLLDRYSASDDAQCTLFRLLDAVRTHVRDSVYAGHGPSPGRLWPSSARGPMGRAPPKKRAVGNGGRSKAKSGS